MPVDIAIDLGTSKTVLYSANKILLEQPTVAAVDSETWQPICFGDRAKSMIGRTSEDREVVFPIQRGMIADYDVAEQMLSDYMSKAVGKHLIKPRVIIAMPEGATSIQRRSASNAAISAGGRRVQVIDTAVAAALGMGIDFSDAGGKLVVDIGAGVTDVAALSAGGIVQCDSAPIGSLDFDEAIIRYVKKQIGSVIGRKEQVIIKAKGRNLFTGLPQLFEISSDDVYTAMHETVVSMCNVIKSVIEKTSPDAVADIMSQKIYVCGGGALINGMEEMLSEYLSSEVKVHRDARHCVAKGALLSLKMPELLKNSDYELRNIEDLVINNE